MAEVQAQATRWHNDHGVQLVGVDYLQLMHGPDPKASREQQVSACSSGMKAMAKALEIPVLVLAQLNRGVETRRNKRPLVSDLRESGAIEQDADLVMLMYREEYYKPDKEEAQRKAEVIVAKQRNGPTGSVQLVFLKNLLKFGDPYRNV